MTTQMFTSLLFLISVLSSLFTEAIKKNLDAPNNLIAGVVSIVISVSACVGYIVTNQPLITSAFVFSCICLCAMSWLCSMLGYDKVMQTLKQLGGKA